MSNAQDVPDHSGRRKDLKQLVDTKGLAAEQADVKVRNTAWLIRSRDHFRQQLWRPRKRHRVAAVSFLRHLDCFLKRTCGDGLAFIQQPVPIDERGCPFTWPSRSVACDMESSGHGGVMAGQRHWNLNLDYTPDTSHGGHRSSLDGLKKAGRFPFISTMMLVRAVPHGPWGEDMRHRQVCLAVDEHVDTTTPGDCPTF